MFRIILLCVLCVCLPAYAGVYKCPDGKGGTLYSDRPCPKGEEVEIEYYAPPKEASVKALGNFKSVALKLGNG
jgi:hypothetical protein